MYFQPHHFEVIEKLKAKFQNDPRYLALIVGGSLAKGWGSLYSDVDIMLVATDDEYNRCVANNTIMYIDSDICNYPGGYVDGKIINLQFLHDVAAYGSEPARAAFNKVFAAYSHIPGLDDLLKTLPVYQESERDEKILAFYSQAQMQNWFIGEAEKRQSVYLMAHAATEMVFYSARLLLAYNRILYPYHKWLMRAVEEAPEKPENFIELAEQLMKEGNIANAQALWQALNNFRDWHIPFDQGLNRFVMDSELKWRNHQTPLQDW